MKRNLKLKILFFLSLYFVFPGRILSQNAGNNIKRPSLIEVNSIGDGLYESKLKAITNVNIVNVRNKKILRNSSILIRGNRIYKIIQEPVIGNFDEPVEIFAGNGLFVLPGLIDVHFHSINNNSILHTILKNGTTALRDPGHPFRFYQSIQFADKKIPRIFLTGAHLDGYPATWVQQAVMVRNNEHIRDIVREHVANGASGIKIYFRLPLKYFETVIGSADFYGVPVTAHLELVDAIDAIKAGLKGIEHVTSFGTSIAADNEVEVFKAAVSKNSEARSDGRYRLWSDIDFNSEKISKTIDLVEKNDVAITPTLATFERRFESGTADFQAKGFQNMMKFVGLAYNRGIKINAASHTSGKYTEKGLAFQREMELLVECGMTPMDVIVSATINNAEFLRTDARVGSLEPDKLADLIMVEGDPTVDIKTMYNIRKVMLNGSWVE